MTLAEQEKRLKFGEWCAMYGGPRDFQFLMDRYVQSGEYPEEFERYMADFEYFEKTGYWPERDF